MKEQVIAFSMTWTNIIALVASIVTFLGVIVSLIIGIYNNITIRKNTKENNFILNVTVERNKWLERIRQDISNYCGLTKFFTRTIKDTFSDEGKNVLKEIDKLNYMIKLRLNPNGKIDKKILDLLEEIPALTNKTNLCEIDGAINKLIGLSQELLKEEWEKVKKESRKGIEIK